MTAYTGTDGQGVASVGFGCNYESAGRKVLLEPMNTSHSFCEEGFCRKENLQQALGEVDDSF